MAQVRARGNRVLEQGDIYFLYRPAVNRTWVQSARDVTRLFILLKPWGASRYRLIVVGRKRLPDPGEHARFWTFVWRVLKDRDTLNTELGEQEYPTKTRGVRKEPAVRPAAEGIYALSGTASTRISPTSWSCPSAAVRRNASSTSSGRRATSSR
jgi:hypothetical protein